MVKTSKPCRKLLKKNLDYESILYNSTELSVDSELTNFQKVLFLKSIPEVEDWTK